ncbi:CapA family protein [Cyclobacterium xiamenense]|uniref:CapA family protein n=1 Tax=Cyclobacterium xiamenense TaxID=1297121 RepID=UPI0035CF87F2
MSKIKIGFTGDFCPWQRVQDGFISGDWTERFQEVLPFFRENDCNIIDLECPLTNATHRISKTGPHIKSIPETAEILKYLTCDLVVTANNHFKDYGWQGMKDSYDALMFHNIGWCGSGANRGEASETAVLHFNEVAVAVINMAENEWTTTHGAEPGCHSIDYPTALQKIQEARAADIDFVAVVLHGGHEHYPLPSPRMKAQFRFMIDAGADAVVGHHTHIVSGYEVYKNKPIFYSLGNFCFDWPGQRNGSWNRGMLLRLVFEKGKHPEFEFSYIHQNDDFVGVRFVDNQLRQELDKEQLRLNAIIADDRTLHREFERYAESLSGVMLSRIQPYRHRFLVALHKRGLLPDLMGSSKRKMLQILTQCESHREVLLSTLKKIN